MWRELSEAERRDHPLGKLDPLHKIAFVLFGIWVAITWIPALIGIVVSIFHGHLGVMLIPGLSRVQYLYLSGTEPDHPLAIYRQLHGWIDAARSLSILVAGPFLIYFMIFRSRWAVIVAKWLIVWMLVLVLGAMLVEWHYWYTSGKWQSIALMKKHLLQLKRVLPEIIIGLLILRHLTESPRLNVIYMRRERVAS